MKKSISIILFFCSVLIADVWQSSNIQGTNIFSIKNEKNQVFEISCNKKQSSVLLKDSIGKINPTNVYAIMSIDNVRRTFASPLNVKNIDDISNWNEILKYLQTADRFYVASSIGGFYFEPTNSTSELNNLLTICTQFISNSKNNSSKKNNLPLIKPENPMEIYVKTSKTPKNALFEINSLDANLTINNVIVNGGNCETDLMPIIRKNRIINKVPKYPLELDKFDSLEVMAWECKRILEIQIETNYGSYFYTLN
ncbi:hypothetical protein [Arcobacter defluvii]|uniref:Uncharacterized protein n=1 Tax=Arcobacter defluvii TaxID=873191 RepID=A0AAE7BHT5_9BACT|nr:hypothetical protein [Arcobacter defluvii]QKF78226.1 hypothetical protein ADFLV_2218 [Arcobacter defluvii]RXI33331.1 hypothetical protein CP964_07095 [Arcobacter defluvii]